MTDSNKKDLADSPSEGVTPVEKAKEDSSDCVELPKGIPEETQKFVRMAMTSTSMGQIRSSNHPLLEKLNEEHVHKFLDYIQKDDDNEFKLKCSNRWFHLAYALIGVALFVFLMIYLIPKDKSLFDQIFKMLVAFAGGLGSGYGIKSYQIKK